MTKKGSIWNILAWIAFAIVVIYILLKILKIIESPVTIDIIALLSATYFVGRYAKRIDDTFNDLKTIKDDIRELDKKCPIFEEKGTKTI